MAKNIVLLSDGTGNSAGKAQKTNVWRLYRALDLQAGDQVAFYDDGVGTQQFKPLMLLGGAVGLGLKENVIELYEVLCRNYQAPDKEKGEDGDRIYLFGFSRGAYTVRAVVGLIHNCGLVRYTGDDAKLRDDAKAKYKEFRRRFNGSAKRAVRRLFDRPLPSVAAPVHSDAPQITFVGVWDTVDAYGFPIDMLALAWDALIYALHFPDRKLSPMVQKAAHAVALDDERHSFHPVLWDEKDETDPRRIEQVWFAGAHANVGGGYAKDELSLVPLDWMMARAEAAGEGNGLRFLADERRRSHDMANLHGAQHDSRAGLAAYFRYKPRRVYDLCHDTLNDVTIEVPKIHESVFERIEGNVVPYGPLGIPVQYDVVGTDSGRDPRSYENLEQAKARVEALAPAWRLVFWRRCLYLALLAATGTLVSSRFFLDWTLGGVCGGPLCFLDTPVDILTAVIPDFAAGWLEALRQNPGWLAGFAIVFLALFISKMVAFRRTRKFAATAWARLKGRDASAPAAAPSLRDPDPSPAPSLAGHRLRFGVAAVAAAVILIVGVLFIDRAVFEIRTALGETCETNGSSVPLSVAGGTDEFTVDEPCRATGIKLEKGTRYRFEVAAASWRDGDIAAGPDGFTNPWDAVKLALMVPARRVWTEPWFKLMGRVGNTGKDRFAIGAGPVEVTARSDGELFLFVNDAVCGFCPGKGWAWPYNWAVGENEGLAKVTVTPLSADD